MNKAVSDIPARVYNYAEAKRLYGVRVDTLVKSLEQADELADAFVTESLAAGRRPLDDVQLVERAVAGQTVRSVALDRLLESVRDHLVGFDMKRLDRCGRLLIRSGPLGGVCLGAQSLLLGYAAPAGNKPLVLTGRLENRAPRRLQETFRFVQAVTTPGGLREGQPGFVIALKVRLIHARVRQLALSSGRWRSDRWSLPINQHDMLGTLLLFSGAVYEGLQRFGLCISAEELDDYLYLWRYVGHLLGVRGDLIFSNAADAMRDGKIIACTQGPPDDDARRLVRALIDTVGGAVDSPGRDRQRAIATSICRFLNEDTLVDQLGLTTSRWDALIPALAKLITPTDWIRSRSNWLSTQAFAQGIRYWQHGADRALRTGPISYSGPSDLNTDR